MYFYVIRHGQTDYNKQGIYQGRKDIPLNEIGVQQARQTAENLKNILDNKKVDSILVSPLTRTKQTAEPICKMFNIQMEICDGFIERSFGNLEGQKPNNKLTNEMMLDYNKNYSIENIEPVQDMFKRVYSCLDAIIESQKQIEQEKELEQNIVIVTHAGVAIAIECYFKGKPSLMNYDTLEPLAPKNAEIRIYKVK